MSNWMLSEKNDKRMLEMGKRPNNPSSTSNEFGANFPMARKSLKHLNLGSANSSKSQRSENLENTANLNTAKYQHRVFVAPALSWSAKKRLNKRKSLLGRNFTKYYASVNIPKIEEMNFKERSPHHDLAERELRPVYASSLSIESAGSQLPKNHQNKSPTNPFNSTNVVNSSAFFDIGLSNNTSHWSVFKARGGEKTTKPAKSNPESSFQALTRMMPSSSTPQLPNPEVYRESLARKLYEDTTKVDFLDNSLGIQPLDDALSSSSLIKQSQGLESKKIQKELDEFLTWLRKESDTMPSLKKYHQLGMVNGVNDDTTIVPPAEIIMVPKAQTIVVPEVDVLSHVVDKSVPEARQRPNNIMKNKLSAFNKLFDLHSEIRKMREVVRQNIDQLFKKEDEFNKVMEQLKDSLKEDSTFCGNSRTTCPWAMDDDKENEEIGIIKIRNESSENKVAQKYTDYRLAYSYLQTPVQNSVNKSRIGSQCYTPKSFSSCIKDQMKDIFG